MTRVSRGFESLYPKKDCRDPEILASAKRRGAIDNKNTPKIYDKRYFKDREWYMTDPFRFMSYAAVCMDLKAKKVLDVGCGINTLAMILRDLGVDAQGVDFSEDADPDVIANATDLHMFKDNSMDLVITTDLLEHLAEDDVHKAIREFDRIAPLQAHFICFEDMHGEMDDDYHLTLKDGYWWLTAFANQGLRNIGEYACLRSRDGSGTEMVAQLLVFRRLNSDV